jgi:hypothetical protein
LHRDLGKVAKKNEIMSAARHPGRLCAESANATIDHAPARQERACDKGFCML